MKNNYLLFQQLYNMYRNRNNSKAKGLSSFRMEINSSQRSSIENPSPQRQRNKRMHVRSSLLHAQRNIKFITKNQIKKQLLDSELTVESLPKLRKDSNRNNSALEKETNIDSFFQDNISKDFRGLKNLLASVKDSKKREKERNLNLLGLSIKRIQPESYPQYRNIDIANVNNILRHRHSSSILRINQASFQSKLILQSQSVQNEEEGRLSSARIKSSAAAKKKTVSISSGSKHEYFHNKITKFNFGIGSEGYKIYERRMKLYRQFIFTIQFAHNVYINNQIKNDECQTNGLYLKNQNKYKVWIGSGNNWMLIKSLIKRRYWWIIVEQKNLNDLNFVWTQIKINQIFQKQKPSLVQEQVSELRETQNYEESDHEQNKQSRSLAQKQDKKHNCNLNFDLLQKIVNSEDKQQIKKYLQKYSAKQNKCAKPMHFRHKYLNKKIINIQQNQGFLVHNHLQNNFFLGNKKAMFYNLKQYYQLIHDNVFNFLPLTFHIRNGTNDLQYKRFQHYYKKRAAYILRQKKQEQQRRKKEQNSQEEEDQPTSNLKKLRNIWIVKPGQLSNRGNGITVIDQLYEINNMLNKKEKHQNGTNKTYIIQLYIDRPFLYNNRKFDIRHYMLITNMFGVMRGYWYQEGYIRTSSYQFDIFTFDKEIHLTNDAVQKYTSHYGKYEQGNKLSYSEFQRYLDSKYSKKQYNFNAQILPKMKKMATDAVRSAFLKLSPDHRQNNFQIFGLDFMIDSEFKPWLIEINTNPCLELSSPLLERIIPVMVENSFRLSLDVMFPPPTHYPNTSKHLVPDLCLQNHKYQLIFDSISEGQQVQRLYRDIRIQKLMDEIGAISDEEDQYQDDGEELNLDQI